MIRKKIFIGVFVVILLIFLVYAIQISNFDNFSTPENLTFTGNQNITRNITLYKNANVTSAVMNLSGYIGYNYQETAESYNFLDGGTMYLNYTKPFNVLNTSFWEVRTGKISYDRINVTIPQDCWDYDINSIHFRAFAVMYGDASGYCENASGTWHKITSRVASGSGFCALSSGNKFAFNDTNWNSYIFWKNIDVVGWANSWSDRKSVV